MVQKKTAAKTKKSIVIDIQYQIKVSGAEASHPKTYEYSTESTMKARDANEKDPYKREINLLKFLVKEFKEHARVQKKKLLAKRKSSAKAKA